MYVAMVTLVSANTAGFEQLGPGFLIIALMAQNGTGQSLLSVVLAQNVVELRIKVGVEDPC